MSNAPKVHCQHDQMVAVTELKEHPKNRNKHPEDQIIRLAEIIEYQGWRKPVIVSKRSGFITAGHGRLMAAKLQGWKEVPVNFQEYETDEQEYADVQADNAIASWAELDLAGVNADLGDLGPNFDIDLLGIRDFVLEPADKLDPQCDEDEMPEAVEPKTKLGDIYRLGKHRLMCGDSTSITDVERLMAGELADMIFTDPPYNVAITGGTHDPRDKDNHGKGPKIMNDSMSDAEFADFLKSAFSNIWAVSREGASIYVCFSDSELLNFTRSFIETGFKLSGLVLWIKQQFVFSRKDYHPQHEPILYGWKVGAAHEFYGERNQSTTWHIDRPMRSEKEHPTQKPVGLPEKAIANSSKPGELLFEPFGGGGSTLIAAEKLNRRVNAMEMDPKYCDLIVARWEKYTGKKAELLDA